MGKKIVDFSVEVFDEADMASALEMEYINNALENHKEKVKPESHPDFDGKRCIDCDAEIPKIRLEMFRIRCVTCQEILEKKSKVYAGRR